jgi:hypothetical protein
VRKHIVKGDRKPLIDLCYRDIKADFVEYLFFVLTYLSAI